MSEVERDGDGRYQLPADLPLARGAASAR